MEGGQDAPVIMGNSKHTLSERRIESSGILILSDGGPDDEDEAILSEFISLYLSLSL